MYNLALESAYSKANTKFLAFCQVISAIEGKHLMLLSIFSWLLGGTTRAVLGELLAGK